MVCPFRSRLRNPQHRSAPGHLVLFAKRSLFPMCRQRSLLESRPRCIPTRWRTFLRSNSAFISRSQCWRCMSRSTDLRRLVLAVATRTQKLPNTLLQPAMPDAHLETHGQPRYAPANSLPDRCFSPAEHLAQGGDKYHFAIIVHIWSWVNPRLAAFGSHAFPAYDLFCPLTSPGSHPPICRSSLTRVFDRELCQ